jgi:hypothetical protein
VRQHHSSTAHCRPLQKTAIECPVGQGIQLWVAGSRSDPIRYSVAWPSDEPATACTTLVIIWCGPPSIGKVSEMGVIRGDSAPGQGTVLRECETSLSIPPQLCTSKNLLSSTIFSFSHSGIARRQPLRVESTILQVGQSNHPRPRQSSRMHPVFAMLTLRGAEPLVWWDAHGALVQK